MPEKRLLGKSFRRGRNAFIGMITILMDHNIRMAFGASTAIPKDSRKSAHGIYYPVICFWEKNLKRFELTATFNCSESSH